MIQLSRETFQCEGCEGSFINDDAQECSDCHKAFCEECWDNHYLKCDA